MPLILGTFVCGYIMVALASLQVEDSGVLPIHRGDILMLFYLTVVNECEDAVQVEARGEHCCDSLFPEDPTACEIMRLTGGHMGLFDPRERRNITLFFVTPVPHGRRGRCDVELWWGRAGGDTKALSHRVPFDTVVRPGAAAPPPPLAEYYDASSVAECAGAAADLDPLDGCAPVDCRLKYGGARPFFLAAESRCVAAPACDGALRAYDPADNACRDLGAALSDEERRLLRRPGGPPAHAHDAVSPYLPLVRCHHGRPAAEPGQCECDEGWSSAPAEAADALPPSTFVLHLCTARQECPKGFFDAFWLPIALGVLAALAAAALSLAAYACWLRVGGGPSPSAAPSASLAPRRICICSVVRPPRPPSDDDSYSDDNFHESQNRPRRRISGSSLETKTSQEYYHESTQRGRSTRETRHSETLHRKSSRGESVYYASLGGDCAHPEGPEGKDSDADGKLLSKMIDSRGANYLVQTKGTRESIPRPSLRGDSGILLRKDSSLREWKRRDFGLKNALETCGNRDSSPDVWKRNKARCRISELEESPSNPSGGEDSAPESLKGGGIRGGAPESNAQRAALRKADCGPAGSEEAAEGLASAESPDEAAGAAAGGPGRGEPSAEGEGGLGDALCPLRRLSGFRRVEALRCEGQDGPQVWPLTSGGKVEAGAGAGSGWGHPAFGRSLETSMVPRELPLRLPLPLPPTTEDVCPLSSSSPCKYECRCCGGRRGAARCRWSARRWRPPRASRPPPPSPPCAPPRRPRPRPRPRSRPRSRWPACALRRSLAASPPPRSPATSAAASATLGWRRPRPRPRPRARPRRRPRRRPRPRRGPRPGGPPPPPRSASWWAC